MNLNELNIAVVGQGYVGLPLAIEFGKKYTTKGFDINEERINDLIKGIDNTHEATTEQIKSANLLTFSSNNAKRSAITSFF